MDKLLPNQRVMQMQGKKEHADDVIRVCLPRRDEKNHRRKEYGNVKMPQGWAFPPAGRAF